MTIEIALFDEHDAEEYGQFLHSVDTALFYASLPYRRILQTELEHCEPLYLVARTGGKIVGVLPSFLRRNARHGDVLNSLPYFGSNGGAVVATDAGHESGSTAVEQALIEAFHALARERGVVTSTLVTNPLSSNLSSYETEEIHDLRDERIGQLTPIPAVVASDLDVAESLMAIYHSKTRNAVRKAQKSGLEVYHSGSEHHLRRLYELHVEGMQAIGVPAKNWSFFAATREHCVYDRDYRVYVAEKDGLIVSALLVFFYNRVAEYYVPATLAEYRPLQPMSVLILEAMCEASRRGCLYWNWGGTQRSNKAVYDFKSSWGSIDRPYQYFVREYLSPNPLRDLSPAEILAEYPSFYVLPFSALRPRNAAPDVPDGTE